MKTAHIAKICHEANKAYCQTQDDWSQHPWELAPPWQQESAIHGVEFHIKGDRTPEESHASWLEEKIKNGWSYGTVKDADKKTHPCCIPYNELPEPQKLKDHLFGAIVKALAK